MFVQFFKSIIRKLTLLSFVCCTTLLNNTAHAKSVFIITPLLSSLSLEKGSSTIVSFNVINNSDVTLTTGNIRILGSELAELSILNSNCTTLAANESCTVNLLVQANDIEGQFYADLQVCSFNGALCSASNPKMQILITSISQTLFSFIANNNKNSLNQSTITRCNIDQTTGSFSNCVGINENFEKPYDVAIHPTANIIYVSNSNDGNYSISYCQYDPSTGNVSTCQRTGPNLSTAVSIWINPTGTFAYIVNQSTNQIKYCRINDTTKALETCNDATLSITLRSPSSIAIDATGSHAYITANNDYYGKILSCPIKADGNFNTCITSYDFNAFYAKPITIALHPLNNRAYITMAGSADDRFDSKIYSCQVNQSTGVLDDCKDTEASSISTPYGITFNTLGTKAFITNYNEHNITQCDVPSNGLLSNCQNSGATELFKPYGITVK